MSDIKSKALLYHLTSLNNVEAILTDELKPRALLKNFEDIADHEILDKRRALGLEEYVPFHWFAGNPFDGAVQKAHPDDRFVSITVRRTLAEAQNWKVIPRHPLARDNPIILDYAEGFETIDWGVMNGKDYLDPEGKSICMAECLCPGIVKVTRFHSIFVANSETGQEIVKLLIKQGNRMHVNVNPRMFLA